MRKAIIVDDHPFIRMAIKLILNQEFIDTVAEASDGFSALSLVRQYKPDLVILDLSMPRGDGLEFMERVSRYDMNCKIIVLTSLPAKHYSKRCFMAGAVGFVNKTEELGELRSAIKTVFSGRVHFKTSNEKDSQKQVALEDILILSSLSNRELSVFYHLALGKSNKEISEILHISNKTVSTYKFRIYEKIGVSSVVDLAEFARRNVII